MLVTMELVSLDFYSLVRPIFGLLILLVCQLHNGSSENKLNNMASAGSDGPGAAAVIVFGDSIVDPGNNNGINTIVKCNFPPYGRDFNGGKSTGRFSNGRVASDIIAEIFNVKKLLPAYLDPNLSQQDLITGVSFASGGSGYDPLTAKLVSVFSLSDQLEMFREYKNKVKSAVGEDRAEILASKSVFIVCIGSDDIANTYFTSPFRSVHYDIQAYTDLMAESASSFLMDLYGEGARRIGVVSLPPIGCVPSQRTLQGDAFRNCAEPENQAAKIFNSKLSSLIQSLNTKLLGAKLVYLDIYNPLLSLIRNPAHYGFEAAKKGCCGTGNLEVSVLCNRYSISTCTDASKFLFWDSYHPSERGYEVLTRLVFNEKVVNKFF